MLCRSSDALVMSSEKLTVNFMAEFVLAFFIAAFAFSSQHFCYQAAQHHRLKVRIYFFKCGGIHK